MMKRKKVSPTRRDGEGLWGRTLFDEFLLRLPLLEEEGEHVRNGLLLRGPI